MIKSRKLALVDCMLLTAFFLSGFAALGYEFLWTRLLIVFLGTEMLGIIGVLTGFFGGLALGAYFLDGYIRRCRRPQVWFAVFECIVAGFAIISPFLYHAIGRVVPPLIGPFIGNNDSVWSLLCCVGLAAVAMLPGTFFMGATFPALFETRRRLIAEDSSHRGVGRLYAANTAGATLGILVSVFFVFPAIGLVSGSVVLAALGVAAAALTIVVAGREVIEPRRADTGSKETAPRRMTRIEKRRLTRQRARSAVATESPLGIPPRLLWLLVFGSGLAGIGLEVIGSRVLAQNLLNTVYTFAAILSVYLVGTTLGAYLYTLLLGRLASRHSATLLVYLLGSLLVAVAGAFVSLPLTAQVVPTLVGSVGIRLGLRYAEVVNACLVYFVPTIIMGALFSHLVACMSRYGVGRAYAVNTLGGTCAPIVFGLFAITAFGYRVTFLLVLVSYALLFYLVTFAVRVRWRWQLLPVVVVLASVFLGPRTLNLIPLPDDVDLLMEHQGLMGVTMVTQYRQRNPDNGIYPRTLQVNGIRYMGGNLGFVEARMGRLGFLMQPQAKDVLVLGVGTGSTLGALVSTPVEHVDAIEIVPSVLESLSFFDAFNRQVRRDRRFTLHAADARRFIASSSKTYDLIVGDLFHPDRDGASSLFSQEHFQAVRSRLRSDGLYLQWLPLHQLNENTLATIVQAFLSVFPNVHSVLAHYNVDTPIFGLLGRTETPSAAAEAASTLALLRRHVEPEFEGIEDLLATYMLDHRGLQQLSQGAPINSDLHPHVLFDAPEVGYDIRGVHIDSLVQRLLALRRVAPEGFPESWSVDARRSVLKSASRYAEAVGQYLEALLLMRASSGNGPSPQLPVAVQEKMLQAYAVDPSVSAIRGHLFGLARENPERAQAIFEAMLEITPDNERVEQEYRSFRRAEGR